MNSRICLSAIGILLLGGCNSGPSTPDGAVLLDEEVTLKREARFDSAQREIAVDGDSVIVAFVDENLTDVKIRLAASVAKDPIAPVEVENNLEGTGIEIAAFAAPRGSRITLTLKSPQDANTPGRVRLRVRRFDAAKDSSFAAQREAFKAWSAATNASHRADAIKKSGLADLDRAIASLEGAQGDAALAAQARLIKANMLYYFQIDPRESHLEAQRAAQAFAALPMPDALNQARARLLDSIALSAIAEDPASVNPTAEEAGKEARLTLAELSGDASPFGSIERARAIDAIGHIDINESLLDEADRRFAAAKALYDAAGYAAGVHEMTANFAYVLVRRGRFYEAAQDYDRLLPDVDKISNPDKRVSVLVSAARAKSFSGRTDEAVENLLKALAQAREFKLRAQEGSASQELGYLYFYRGDTLQAKAFFLEALRITREDQDVVGLGYTLQSAGMMARFDGDYATAIEMHEEAVRRTSNPVGKMRAIRLLALDYLADGNYPEAIAQFRRSLAVKVQDPNHHAFADVRRELAQTLVEHGDGSSAALAEAAALLADNLQRCIEVQDRLCEIGARGATASLLAKQGKPAQAQTAYERAFALIFDYRKTTANPQLRTATLGHEQAAFRGYFDLMLRNVVANGPAAPRRASAAEEGALRMLELARESHFGALRAEQLSVATLGRVDALYAQMADKSLEIATLLKRKLTAQESVQLTALQLDMSKLRLDIDRERTAAAAAPVTDKSPTGAARAWRAITPGTVQLSYALGNEHAYVWTRSDAGTQVAMLSESPETIERELAAFVSLDRQASPDKVEQSLAHISSALLPAKILPANSNVVEVVAEGRIASVPFAGLRSPTDPAHRLVETHAIAMITSLFAMEEPPRPKQARPFRFVALASGSGTLRSAPVSDPAPKLQAATAEIRAVADLFEARDKSANIKLLTGREGSAAALRGIWSSGADVVHFATHALADLRQPLASLLVLPANDAAGTSTYLTAGQVQEWRGDADLVFLSACESAIGPPRFAGGMPGLQSAFLRAGARGVIATLWPIEDVLAQEFSTDFYRRFTGGQSAAQSLSATQRDWLAPKPGASDAEQLRRRITALAHGMYTQ